MLGLWENKYEFKSNVGCGIWNGVQSTIFPFEWFRCIKWNKLKHCISKLYFSTCTGTYFTTWYFTVSVILHSYVKTKRISVLTSHYTCALLPKNMVSWTLQSNTVYKQTTLSEMQWLSRSTRSQFFLSNVLIQISEWEINSKQLSPYCPGDFWQTSIRMTVALERRGKRVINLYSKSFS